MGLSIWTWISVAIAAASYDGSIVGGTPVAPRDPIAASTVTLTGERYMCSGSIVASDVIVTAAHCVRGGMDLITFGVNSFDPTAPTRRVLATRATPLSGYDHAPDIGVILFGGGLPEGYRTVPMLGSARGLREGMPIVIAGFGITSPYRDEGSGRLRKVTVSLRSADAESNYVILDQPEGKGACHGDSGGPAFATVNGRRYLIGVDSRNTPRTPDCTRAEMYTSVMSMRSWLAQAVRSMRAAHSPSSAESE